VADELWQKFALPFEILTKDMIEAARSETRSVSAVLIAPLIPVAQRGPSGSWRPPTGTSSWSTRPQMAAHYVGGEVKETKRYKLGGWPDPWRATSSS